MQFENDGVNYNGFTENTFKDRFANTAMPSSARVRQVPGNYQSISEK